MDYRASKAWHISYELALEIHELVREVDQTDRTVLKLASRLKRSSAMVPLQIKASVQKELHHEKLACYMAARHALEDLHKLLRYSLKQDYIKKDYFKQLEDRAKVAYRELGYAIESTERNIAKLAIE